MPRFWIYDIVWDEYNELHSTERASKEQIRSILFGDITAKMNKKNRSARYMITDRASDGSKWTIVFNYDKQTGIARPISAWPAK